MKIVMPLRPHALPTGFIAPCRVQQTVDVTPG
jgi:hypothetical protein